MNKLLPSTSKNITSQDKGFTLIELLVVIAIIAILAIIGLTVFSGQQRNARDARRKGDIDAISKAMESNYDDTNANYPGPLLATMFTGSAIPTDPLEVGGVGGVIKSVCGGLNGGGAQACRYCYALAAAAPNCAAGGEVGTVPAAVGKTYSLCAALENAAVAGVGYCVSSQR